MNSALMSRRMLHAQLRKVALRLLARQALRAGMNGVLWGSVFAISGVLLFVVLPRVLALEFAAGAAAAGLSGVAGFCAGAYRALRRASLPRFEDAALALEARIQGGDGALATALQLRDGDRFETPVLQSASRALTQALGQPAPHLFTLKVLVAAPAAALVAIVALVWALGATPPDTGKSTAVAASGGSFALDVATTRSDADRVDVAGAMGLKKVAAVLNDAAQTLRAAEASESERQNALDDARQAARTSGDPRLAAAGEELPETVPADAKERENLATRIEELAGGAAERAGTADQSSRADGGGDLNVAAARSQLVPFPEIERHERGGTNELALQTPERRAMAQRAMAELETLRNR